MVTDVYEGALLWEPPARLAREARITEFMSRVGERHGVTLPTYEDLWRWSVENLGPFWDEIWQYFGVESDAPYTSALADRTMPGTEWFPGARINYARQVFRNATPDAPAVLWSSERHPLSPLSWDELQSRTAALASALRDAGVRKGDRVVGYLPNIPHSVIALLACASLGAIWSSCSPDFGTESVVDRFRQIEPAVLFAVDGYQYGGKAFDRMEQVGRIAEALPSVRRTVLIPYLNEGRDAGGLRNSVLWDDFRGAGNLEFEPVPFDHPLWVLYSSGTTGLPKAIVQGQGGIMLEHMKALALHGDLGPGSRFFWFTTTGWMMWNYLVGGLLVGSTIVLYDGSPAFPDMDALWTLAERAGVTAFGTSAPYLTSCMKGGLRPGADHDLSKLVSVGSTGAPLPPEGFAWVYNEVKPDIWLASVSGGTDLCTAFLLGCPLLPVRAGEIQCRGLGADVRAFDESGHAVVNEVGELVITQPMPSMPLFFWNDPGGRRYHESYFETYDGIWRHGDWIKITPQGGAVIYGRSDSTLNRMGVRVGTSEIYSAVEEIPEVVDSLIVGLERPHGEYYMPLFVVLAPGAQLDDPLRESIRRRIRQKLSPRHVPDDIFAVEGVPRTLNGKKMEVPVKKILLGAAAERAANPGGMANPESIAYFVDFARTLNAASE